MLSEISKTEIAALVEKDRVHKRVYTDPDIFDLEMKRVWGQAWVFVGHESQVSNPGDYFSTSIGAQAVIMTRDKEGKVNVLFNRCSHKGAQLVGDDAGHVGQFRCPYHGYVFETDGTLAHIPQEEGYKGSDFCKGKKEANIRKVPRMQLYRGFVFASLSAEGEELETWLGPTLSSLDNVVDRSPLGEIEICGGRLRYLHDANWKILLENVSDNMHAQVTHQSAYQPATILGKDFTAENKPLEIAMLETFGSSYDLIERAKFITGRNGHSYADGAITSAVTHDEKSTYVKDLIAIHGNEKTQEILNMSRQNTIIYPSIAFKSTLQTIRVYRPLSVNKTIQETWTYRLKGAPDEFFENSIRYNQLVFSPSSIAGHDDYEAYHRIQHGLQTQGLDWVSQHRLVDKHSENNDGYKESSGISDMVFRNKFEAWKQYMVNV